jgi:hypothetical protein
MAGQLVSVEEVVPRRGNRNGEHMNNHQVAEKIELISIEVALEL